MTSKGTSEESRRLCEEKHLYQVRRPDPAAAMRTPRLFGKVCPRLCPDATLERRRRLAGGDRGRLQKKTLEGIRILPKEVALPKERL